MKPPRNPISALVRSVFGFAFLSVAVVLLGWVVLTRVAVARGFDVAMWAARHSPIPLSIDPVDFGNRAINSPWIWFIATFGAVALMAALRLLLSARLDLRPAGESDDGEARLELKGPPPRVGSPLEGAVMLGGNAVAGDRYKLQLECRNMEGVSNRVARTLYRDTIEVSAVPDAGGASLPFRFEIPLTIPPTTGTAQWRLRDPLSWGFHRWVLVVDPVKRWFGSTFPLEVAPGPEAAVRAAIAAMPPRVVEPTNWKLLGMVVGGVLGAGIVLGFLVNAVIWFFRGA